MALCTYFACLVGLTNSVIVLHIVVACFAGQIINVCVSVSWREGARDGGSRNRYGDSGDR